MGNADPDPNKAHILLRLLLDRQGVARQAGAAQRLESGRLLCSRRTAPDQLPRQSRRYHGTEPLGAAFTQIVTSKGSSYENRLMVVDVDGTATRRYHLDPLRIDENWHIGTMPDIQSEIMHFEDRPDATFASVRVKNADGLPVVYDREFVFAKNRFLATREIVTFEESFKARVAPLWNTRNVGPQIGATGQTRSWEVWSPATVRWRCCLRPPICLYGLPRARTAVCRWWIVLPRIRGRWRVRQVRYLWEGTPKAGDKLVFTQVYYPHVPYRASVTSNLPGAKATYADALQATAGTPASRLCETMWRQACYALSSSPGKWNGFRSTLARWTWSSQDNIRKGRMSTRLQQVRIDNSPLG